MRGPAPTTERSQWTTEYYHQLMESLSSRLESSLRKPSTTSRCPGLWNDCCLFFYLSTWTKAQHSLSHGWEGEGEGTKLSQTYPCRMSVTPAVGNAFREHQGCYQSVWSCPEKPQGRRHIALVPTIPKLTHCITSKWFPLSALKVAYKGWYW